MHRQKRTQRKEVEQQDPHRNTLGHKVSDHAAHGSGRKGRTPISGAASPEGEAHPEDLENPTESTALLGGNGSEEEEPAVPVPLKNF